MICRSLSATLLGLALFTIAPGCCHTAPTTAPVSSAPDELTQTPYLYEIVRYLYRWQFTESDVERISNESHLTFWIHPVHTPLDPDDHSQLAEIILPQLKLTIELKKADYVIKETNETVKNVGYKITDIRPGSAPSVPPPDCQVVTLPAQEMIDFIFRTRDQHDDPAPGLLQHMRRALRAEAAKDHLLPDHPIENPVVYISPLSPVANELWVYWEAGRKLIYFSSDYDLNRPNVWDTEEIRVQIYDLDDQVVLSHEEAPASNRFLTRLEAARVLFNCMVLGDRITFPTFTEAPAQSK